MLMTTSSPDGGSGSRATRFDSTVAHPARVYDYWLGGKDNFQADREAGRQVIDAQPGILFGVHANRAFLGRVVRFLAGECGIRQFLDIGTGIPTQDKRRRDHRRRLCGRRAIRIPESGRRLGWPGR